LTTGENADTLYIGNEVSIPETSFFAQKNWRKADEMIAASAGKNHRASAALCGGYDEFRADILSLGGVERAIDDGAVGVVSLHPVLRPRKSRRQAQKHRPWTRHISGRRNCRLPGIRQRLDRRRRMRGNICGIDARDG
jgi:hypothetical protein